MESPGVSPFRGHGLYIWDEAEAIIHNQSQWDEFFRRMESWQVRTLYLSWGAVSELPDPQLRSFLEASHARNFRVEAMIGTQGVDGLDRAEIEVNHINSFQTTTGSADGFDGIHLDLEPGDDDVARFLQQYQGLLHTMDRQHELNNPPPISLAISWWWHKKSRRHWKKLLDVSRVDYVVVMAYFNSVDKVIKRTDDAIQSMDMPFVIALEADRGLNLPSERNVTGSLTPKRVEQAVRRQGSRHFRKFYQGLAFHHYEELL